MRGFNISLGQVYHLNDNYHSINQYSPFKKSILIKVNEIIHYQPKYSGQHFSHQLIQRSHWRNRLIFTKTKGMFNLRIKVTKKDEQLRDRYVKQWNWSNMIPKSPLTIFRNLFRKEKLNSFGLGILLPSYYDTSLSNFWWLKGASNIISIFRKREEDNTVKKGSVNIRFSKYSKEMFNNLLPNLKHHVLGRSKAR